MIRFLKFNLVNILNYFITFCYPRMLMKALLLGQIFLMGILIDLNHLNSPKIEKHIFSCWFLCASVGVSIISIIQKQITA